MYLNLNAVGSSGMVIRNLEALEEVYLSLDALERLYLDFIVLVSLKGLHFNLEHLNIIIYINSLRIIMNLQFKLISFFYSKILFNKILDFIIPKASKVL